MKKNINSFLILIGIVMIAAMGCIGGGTKTTSPTTIPAATTSHPVASVKLTFVNGVITSDVTNNMDSTELFMLVVDCYNGDVKIDTRIVDVPPLAAGETGRVKGYAPTGTDSIRLSSVATSIGGKLYKVTYELI